MSVHKPGTQIHLGHGKEKFEATIVGVIVKQAGVLYEVAYWKERNRIVEHVNDFEIHVNAGEKKSVIGFVAKD